RHAAALCEAEAGFLYTTEGPDLARTVASYDVSGAHVPGVGTIVHPVNAAERRNLGWRVYDSRATIEITDVRADPDLRDNEMYRAGAFRSLLGVPLLKDGAVIGVITLWRKRPGSFGERQIELVETFASQAIIAIDNARLFNETKESLEQQTATSDVLKAISMSTSDLQPVFDALVERAARLCDADMATVNTRTGDTYRVSAGWNLSPEWFALSQQSVPIDRGTASGRVYLEDRTIQWADVLEDPELDARAQRLQSASGSRTLLCVPIRKDGRTIGTIVLRRSTVRPFAARQIALVETFAEQAGIAIENVRLFNETKESLEQQTASAEVLKVISRTTSDVTPVLQVAVENASRLLGESIGVGWLLKSDGLQFMVMSVGPNTSPERKAGADAFRDLYAKPVQVVRGSIPGRAILERQTIQVADVLADPEYTSQSSAKAGGYRAVMAVPLLRDGEPVGALSFSHPEPVGWSDRQVRLAESFASQVVIAIENVRLFNETKESLERQTALGEILEVIASSPTDQQPVLDAIVRNAVRFCGGEDAILGLNINGGFTARAHYGPIGMRAPEEAWPIDRETVIGRAFVDRTTVQVADLLNNSEFPASAMSVGRFGFRAALATPLLREGEAIGVITLRRSTPGAFSAHDEELLRAFAAQAVIAIENVRLFRETTDALERQTATSDVLDVISRSAFDIAPVLQTIADSSAALCRADHSVVWQRDGDEWFYDASSGDWPADAPSRRTRRI
ncbi:MAG TPA: GAF domain-containing protein, partial [Candidatus Limnocylindrales bacterium]|nr:GAF domain-containing protein [Candidatus Limnocylindrales bacterium]